MLADEQLGLEAAVGELADGAGLVSLGLGGVLVGDCGDGDFWGFLDFALRVLRSFATSLEELPLEGS